MSSSIFSFKALLVFISLLAIVAVELYAQSYGTEISYGYMDNLIKETPDIIMIGNSMLGDNIARPEFEAELSELVGRDITAVFLVQGGQHSSWWYLMIKNQIAPISTDAPVGIVYRLDFLTRPKWAISGNYRKPIEALLTQDESVYYEKTRGPEYEKIRRIYRTYVYRDRISEEFRTYWLNWVFISHKDPIVLMNRRFKSNNLRIKTVTMPTEETDIDHGIRINNPMLNFNKSLLPDMIDILGSRLFTVEMHINPNETDEQLWKHSRVTSDHMQNYRSYLKEYLKDNSVQHIALNEFDELNDSDLYRDNSHLEKNMSILAARLLAREIYEQEIIR